ncbi:hypothetical protein DL93DRAFT_2081051 [Clavulina sp. PMI_390]|nr:hypothetical protein DL93DRAFT_2081051 [Clavulina sp. PMI_390]
MTFTSGFIVASIVLCQDFDPDSWHCLFFNTLFYWLFGHFLPIPINALGKTLRPK